MMILLALIQMGVVIWSRKTIQKVKLWTLQYLLKLVCLICGLKVIHLTGASDNKEPGLLVCNHMSYLDILAIGSLFPVTFMAKLEISSWPLFGQVVALSDGIFVKREDIHSRVGAAFELSRTLKRHGVCIFPEGTTTQSGLPQPGAWQPGGFASASRAGVKVMSCGLAYSHPKAVAWYGDMELVPHLWNMLKVWHTEVVLVNDEIIPHSNESGRAFAERVRQDVLEKVLIGEDFVNRSRSLVYPLKIRDTFGRLKQKLRAY